MKTSRKKSAAPRNAALVAEAESMLQRGFTDPAIDALREVLAADPSSAAANNLLAIALVMTGDGAAAVPHANAAILAAPRDARTWFSLGRAHKSAGALGDAIAAYRRAVELDPAFAEAWVSLGIALVASDELDAGIAAYERAIAIKPGLGVAHANLGNALAIRAERNIRIGADEIPSEEAIAAQARAVELDPDNMLLHRNHGVLLENARRRIEAAGAYERALQLDPSDAEACLRLDHCLRSLGDNVLSRELFTKWLQMNPPNPAVMRAFSSYLTRSGSVDEALDWAVKSIALEPDPRTMVQMCGTLLQARRVPEALEMGRRAVDEGHGDFNFYPVVLLGSNYLLEDPQALSDLHAEFGKRLPPSKPRPAWHALKPGERLKIGYVSGDFMSHSVAHFVSALLERHDRDRFEVYLYHNRGFGDHVTERLKALGHHWFECDALSDEALHRRIGNDGIDIAIDLAGHTENSRVFMFSMGAAPVQIAYLGYPTASGVPATDFRITDGTIDPGDMPVLDSEKPLLLPRSMFCFRADESPAIGEPPSRRNGHVTFGSFNNIAKVTDQTLAMWAGAMNAVPGSRLLLKSGAMAQPSNREGIERFMAARGIAPERLTLAAWVAAKAGHLELYNDIDIALDPYPYNGATTSCEALWMGVPVVTRRGPTHTSRMGASLLAAIGRTEWVADNDAAFAAVAARIAGDEALRAAWRSGARAHLLRSELCDEAGFTRDFEAALLRAWQLAGERTTVDAVQPEAMTLAR